jgi:hypothetical protein
LKLLSKMYVIIAFSILTVGTIFCYRNGYVMKLLKYLYIPPSLKQIDKYTYIVSYSHKGQQYNMFIPIHRGPRQVVRIFNHEQIDVTNEIKPYLGPNEDFHGALVTPAFLDHIELHFHTRNTIHSFLSHETITL